MPWFPNMRGSGTEPSGWTYQAEVDWCSQSGAIQLAQAFKGFWARRGVDVQTEIYCSNPTSENPVWSFRSNIGPVGVTQ
jgi:hypothetical protein